MRRRVEEMGQVGTWVLSPDNRSVFPLPYEIYIQSQILQSKLKEEQKKMRERERGRERE